MTITETIEEKRRLTRFLDNIYKDEPIAVHSEDAFLAALAQSDTDKLKKELAEYKDESFKINLSNEEQICRTFVYFYDALIMCGEPAKKILNTLEHLKDVYVDVNLGFSEYLFQVVMENKQLMLTVIKRINGLMKADESSFESMFLVEEKNDSSS